MKRISIVLFMSLASLLLGFQQGLASNGSVSFTITLETGEIVLCVLTEDTNWSCSFVVRPVEAQVMVVGTGVGVGGAEIWLFCYEHESNGRPTGEIYTQRIM